jgi:hypothetical protein
MAASADYVFLRAVVAIVVMAATTTSLVLVAVYTA